VGHVALEVADIFRSHGPAWRNSQRGRLSLGQLKVMSAIEQCRSAALGGHVLRCEGCGTDRIAYNSCLMESVPIWGVWGRRGAVSHWTRACSDHAQLTITSDHLDTVVEPFKAQPNPGDLDAGQLLLRPQDASSPA